MVDGVFDDYDEESVVGGGATPRAHNVDPYTPTRPRRQVDTSGSPLAKRRKLDTPTTLARSRTVSLGSTPNKSRLPARALSALDVLADQAAQEQERRPSVDGGSQRPSVEPDPIDSPTKSISKRKGKGKAVGRLMDGERNPRRPPSAPPPLSTQTTLVDLRAPRSRRSPSHVLDVSDEEEVPTRPSTPPNMFVRAVSEEPSPSRRIRAADEGAKGGRRNLGTPRRITVIPVQPSGPER